MKMDRYFCGQCPLMIRYEPTEGTVGLWVSLGNRHREGNVHANGGNAR